MILVRLPKLVSALAILCVAACDLTSQTSSSPSGKVVTPFTWKANTPRATVAYDLNECELAGRGLPPNAVPSAIAKASQSIDQKQIEAAVESCLVSKGYTVKDLPVCTDDDYSKGSILAAPEVYPPLDAIMCLNPIARHMVVRS
jgi:hypothetical protein